MRPKLLDTLREIDRYSSGNLYAPTLRELGEKAVVSRVTIFERVEELIDMGLLTRKPHDARSLRLASRAKILLRDEPRCPRCHGTGRKTT